MNHLAALVEDPSVRSVYRARLPGYLQKWKRSRVVIGSALYIDVLKPASTLSSALQEDDLDIVGGIKQVLKSSKSLQELLDQDASEWPTLQLVCCRTKEEKGEFSYKGAVLSDYSPDNMQQCWKDAIEDLKKLDQEMRSRLEWSNVEHLWYSWTLRAKLLRIRTQI